MDLLSEASGTRVLTARHIISEKAPPVHNAINTTVLCHNLSLQPDFQSYFEVIQPIAWILWSCGAGVVVSLWILFYMTLRNARRHWTKSGASLVIVLAVYPLVALSGLVVLVVPRARMLAEAAAQQAVMLAMYHFFCLLRADFTGDEKLIRRAGDSRLDTRVLPCCCWPCCVLPRPKLDVKTLEWMRCVVLQLPIVQGLIYVLMLIIWAEDMMLLSRSFAYFQPLVIGSILLGVWGVIMLVKAVEDAGVPCRRRFLAVQLVLIVVKAQCGAAKVLPELATLPCLAPLHPAVIVHLVQYSIMMLEMLALSLWAYHQYAQAPPGQPPQLVVAVLHDPLDCKPRDEGKGKINE